MVTKTIFTGKEKYRILCARWSNYKGWTCRKESSPCILICDLPAMDTQFQQSNLSSGLYEEVPSNACRSTTSYDRSDKLRAHDSGTNDRAFSMPRPQNMLAPLSLAMIPLRNERKEVPVRSKDTDFKWWNSSKKQGTSICFKPQIINQVLQKLTDIYKHFKFEITYKTSVFGEATSISTLGSL